MTIQYLLTEWLENYQKDHIKENTYNFFSVCIRYCCDTFDKLSFHSACKIQ